MLPVTEEAKNASTPKSIDDFANHEIVTFAVFACGGQLHPVDTEDIAIKAHEIAPGRFAWRKYPDQVSLDSVRKRLWDAASPEKGYGYVLGSERKGWSLTPFGLNFVNDHLPFSDSMASERKRYSVEEKKWVTRERARLLESSAVQKMLAGEIGRVTHREAEMVFRLDDYVTGDARRRKIDRLLNLLGNDDQLGSFVKALANLLDNK
jgi:hypothetical protein